MKELEPDPVYDIIQLMREAKDKYCNENGIEGSAYCVDIIVYETDHLYSVALRKVVDCEYGYARWWKSHKDE